MLYTLAAIHSSHLGPLPEAGRQLGPVPPARAYCCSTSQYHSQYYTGRIRRKVVEGNLPHRCVWVADGGGVYGGGGGVGGGWTDGRGPEVRRRSGGMEGVYCGPDVVSSVSAEMFHRV